MKLILSYLKKKEKILILAAALCGVLQIWLDLTIPKYMKGITTMINTGSSTEGEIFWKGAQMLGCAMLALIAAGAMGYFAARIGAGISMTLREEVFHKTMSFSLEEVGKFSAGSLITRCTNDITRVQRTFSSATQVVFRAPMTAIFAICMMGVSGKEWTGMVAVSVFVMVTVMIMILRAMRPQVRRMQRKTDDLNRITREHLIGLKVVHAFSSYDYEEDKSENVNAKLADAVSKSQMYYAAVTPFLGICTNLMNVGIYLIGAYLIAAAGAKEQITLFSEMVTFSSYVTLVVGAFTQLLVVFTSVSNTTASIERINEVLLTPQKITDGPEAWDPKVQEGDTAIEFRHVYFRYDAEGGDALKDISFKVKKGQTVALIGATGCGKTSILNLICRMYDAYKGEVLVNGHNVKDYKLKDLRSNIGYVPQKSILFSGTIAENINYGDNGRFQATLKEIKKAAEVGQAREFIENKEGSYQALVSRGGSNFSGGQRQRLTISRAICRDPEIFIFDDSFSALDFATDKRLRRALKQTAEGATVLIVAQRIGTIRDADQILVVDEGQIVGQGRHEELLRTCEVYRQIALSQLSEEEVRGLEAFA